MHEAHLAVDLTRLEAGGGAAGQLGAELRADRGAGVGERVGLIEPGCQRALNVEDNGMGDVLRFDAERLRILVERHHLHTGSARARELLEDWERAVACFVKVMPRNYKRALLQARERATAKVAAE